MACAARSVRFLPLSFWLSQICLTVVDCLADLSRGYSSMLPAFSPASLEVQWTLQSVTFSPAPIDPVPVRTLGSLLSDVVRELEQQETVWQEVLQRVKARGVQQRGACPGREALSGVGCNGEVPSQHRRLRLQTRQPWALCRAPRTTPRRMRGAAPYRRQGGEQAAVERQVPLGRGCLGAARVAKDAPGQLSRHPQLRHSKHSAPERGVQ